MKEETLEEAAKKYTEQLYYKVDSIDEFNGEPLGVHNAFIEGANYQAKRMYSEEEVRELLTQRSKHWGTSVKPFDKLLLRQDLEWFEENKKK